MEIKEISAIPLEKLEITAKDITQEDIEKIDQQMRIIEKYETFMVLEWGYWFYVGCQRDEEGRPHFRKLGFDTEDEWIKSFSNCTRRTAYNKRTVYLIWSKHWQDMPLDKFFQVGYSKLLMVRHELDEHTGDKKKIYDVIEDAAHLTRSQLLQKYRGKPLRVRWTATLGEVIGDTVTLEDFTSRVTYQLPTLKGEKLKGYFEFVQEDHG